MKLMRSLIEMIDLKKIQSSIFDTIARRKLIEYQDTILELIGKIQELQNEINCMSDSVKFNYVFQPCNDTFQFGVIVPTLYNEYTALVKSGNVASKHVNG